MLSLNSRSYVLGLFSFFAVLILLLPKSSFGQAACSANSATVAQSWVYAEETPSIPGGVVGAATETPGSIFYNESLLIADVATQTLNTLNSVGGAGCTFTLASFTGGTGQWYSSWSYSGPTSCGTNAVAALGGGSTVKLQDIATSFCPSGYTVQTNGSCALVNSALAYCEEGGAPGNGGSSMVAPSKTDGCNCSMDYAGDPVNVASGNVFEEQTDYDAGPKGLSFKRYYNQDYAVSQGTVGINWRGSFDRQIVLSSDPSFPTNMHPGPLIALVYRPDGSILTFNVAGATPVPTDPDTVETLTQSGTSYTLTSADDTVETYTMTTSVRPTGPRTVGLLNSIQFRGGITQTLNYNASQNLSTVTDSFGHTLTFTFDTSNRLSTILDPAGNLYSYQYNSNGYLATVYYPGPILGSTSGAPERQYTYVSYAVKTGVTAYKLLSLIDENGNTFATWQVSGNLTASNGASQNSYTFEGYSSPVGTSAQVVDAVGYKTYTFSVINGVPKTTKVVYNNTYTKTMGYDTSGNVTAETDYNGNTTTHQYNSRLLETSRTEASGTSSARTIATTWHPTFHLPTQISIYAGGTATGTPLQNVFFIYDTAGNISSKTISDPAANVSRTWTYTHDSFGNLLTTTGPRTDVLDQTLYSYNSCTTGYGCGQLQSVTDSAGHVTQLSSYTADGLPQTITDPNGVASSLTYDPRGRILTNTTGTETVTFSYQPTGLISQTTFPDGASLSYTYDTAHRITKITDSAGNYKSLTLSTMGDVTAEKYYDPTNTLTKELFRTYDTFRRMSGLYGASDSSSGETTYAYDGNRNLTTQTAPLSRTSHATYDSFNYILTATDPLSGVTTYHYNGLNQTTSITDPRGFVTSYQRNALGDLSQLSSPDTGVKNYTYDSGGNLASSTDARGATASYSYDDLNRLITASFAVAGTTDETLGFTYDTGTYGVGRLTGASDANHSMAWSYDSHGRVSSKSQTVGGLARTVSYGYTNNDLTQLTTPSGQVVTYSYANGRASSISINGTSLLSSISYESFGPIRKWTWGGGAVETRSYNTDGNPSQFGGSELYNYTYDNAYRTTGIADASNSALSYTYTYDVDDRLLSGATSSASIGWTYDADGNRATQSGISEAYTYSNTNNSLSSESGTTSRTYSYDNAGHTSSNSVASFTYNGRGRMVSSTNGSLSTAYVYNALGERVEKFSSSLTEFFVYDESGHLLGEYNSSGGLIQETVWLYDTPVAVIQPNGGSVSVYYIHSNELNAPRIITTSAGAVVWRWDRDPFATANANSNPSGLGTFSYNLRLPGQYSDAETGLNYNYQRDYDPQTGRYLESDPTGLAAGINTYAYANDSPIYSIDPSGLSGLLAINTAEYGSSSNSSGAFGHSWISYTPDGGVRTTYGTWGNNPRNLGNGLHLNGEANRVPDLAMSTHLNDAQEALLYQVIGAYADKGADGWSTLSPCSTFATDAWNTATGETLSPGIISNPASLGRSIFSQQMQWIKNVTR